MRFSSKFLLAMTAMALLLLSGCAHQIAFEDVHYAVNAKQRPDTVVAVIDKGTLNQVVSIRSFMTGIAHSWDAEPGRMLKQVADIELPQMFAHYNFENAFPELQNKQIVIEFFVPSYTFDEFKATVNVRAVVYGPNKNKILDRTYIGVGDTQGGKMFWGGAFAMKSAVRQSSLDALKTVFNQLRADMMPALEASLTKS